MGISKFTPILFIYSFVLSAALHIVTHVSDVKSCTSNNLSVNMLLCFPTINRFLVKDPVKSLKSSVFIFAHN